MTVDSQCSTLLPRPSNYNTGEVGSCHILQAFSLSELSFLDQCDSEEAWGWQGPPRGPSHQPCLLVTSSLGAKREASLLLKIVFSQSSPLVETLALSPPQPAFIWIASASQDAEFEIGFGEVCCEDALCYRLRCWL